MWPRRSKQPAAVRAVAGRAPASGGDRDPVHLIVRSNGDMGGIWWGIKRKQKLLEMEAAASR